MKCQVEEKHQGHLRGQRAAEVGQLAVGTAKLAWHKAEDLLGVVRLKGKLLDRQARYHQLLGQLGRRMYEVHRCGREEGASISSLFVEADQLSQEMEQMKAELARRQGRPVCTGCGRSCKRGDIFCASCGQVL